jgi:hypothetical protein
MNTETGAWARFVNWDAACFEILDNQVYMGMAGKVAKAWYGTADFDGVISCYAKPAFDYLRPAGRQKLMKLVRPTLAIAGRASVDIELDTDFQDGTSYGASSFPVSTGTSNFDTANWVADGGTGAVWAGDAIPNANWRTLAGAAFLCAAPRLRVLAQNCTVSWSSTDFVYEVGGIM